MNTFPASVTMAHSTALSNVQGLLSTMTGGVNSPLKQDVGSPGYNKAGDFIYIKHEDGQHVLLPTALAQQLTQYTPAGILPSSALMKKARKRAPNWSNEEQACLVGIWSAPDMQEKFKKATRKWPLWEEMGKMLERAGFYGRDAKQCEALMHRLKSTYYRCVNHNRQPGNEPQYCAFYNEIDAVLSQKDACKSYVESDEESRVSDGDLVLEGERADSDEEKNSTNNITNNITNTSVSGSNNTVNQDHLKQFVEQLAESQLQNQLKASYPASLLPMTSLADNKLGAVDYASLMKLLKADTMTSTPSKTSPKMADSTTMGSPGCKTTVPSSLMSTMTSPPMSMPRTPQNNKRPRPSSPGLINFSTEEYLQNILTQSQLHALTVPGKLPGPYNSLQDLKLLNRTTTTASNVTNSLHSTTVGVTNHDLDRVCSNITDKLLEYFQARDQAFLSLNEKRIRLEEERERKRVEREAEIELKRHHLIVKVCELITNKCNNSVPMVTTPSPIPSPLATPESNTKET
ncbi:hypothetical protein ACHWQZ_G002420 [Mnemiopsis leidyi]